MDDELMEYMIGLNPRQKKFVYYYVGDSEGNALDAATRAGYRNARSYSQKLMKSSRVLMAIDKCLAHVVNRCDGLTPNEIQSQLKKIAMDEDEATRDRLRALEIAAKINGMFIHRAEVNVNQTSHVQVYIPDNGRSDGDVIDIGGNDE